MDSAIGFYDAVDVQIDLFFIVALSIELDLPPDWIVGRDREKGWMPDKLDGISEDAAIFFSKLRGAYRMDDKNYYEGLEWREKPLKAEYDRNRVILPGIEMDSSQFTLERFRKGGRQRIVERGVSKDIPTDMKKLAQKYLEMLRFARSVTVQD